MNMKAVQIIVRIVGYLYLWMSFDTNYLGRFKIKGSYTDSSTKRIRYELQYVAQINDEFNV